MFNYVSDVWLDHIHQRLKSILDYRKAVSRFAYVCVNFQSALELLGNLKHV